MDDIRIEISISAPPEAVYTCCTSSILIARWLSDTARLQVREGGVYTLTWNKGHWAAGIYSAVEPNQRLTFSWSETNSPGASQIDVAFAAENGGTRVTLTHSGFGSGAAWETYRAEMSGSWREMLENLRVLLETGNDARLLKRPAFGLNLIPISAEEAALKGLPVSYGMNLTVVVEGGAAHAAGLRAGDYLTVIDGTKQAGFGEFNEAIGRHKAGDTVAIEYYRDNQKFTGELTFRQRQPPEIPATREALYSAVENAVAEIETELDGIFAGVPESALMVKPAPHEWSAKEVLAHLIWTERWSEQYEWLMITAATATDWGFNNDFEIGGMVDTRPAAADLLAELKLTMREQLHNIPHIPDSVLAVKPLFALLALWLAATGEHCREHYDQIRAAIAHAQTVQPA